MIARLELELETENHEFMPYEKAVILQSVLMKEIEADYAEKLHLSGIHPYSQAIINEKGKNIWSIYTTNEEAYQFMIKPLERLEFKSFKIKNNSLEVMVKQKELLQIEKDKFLERYYFENHNRYFVIRFRTPTAFKQQGSYIYYPDLQLIYQSLMNRYDAADQRVIVFDSEVLDQLAAYSKIIQYRLQSTYYVLGKVKIPAFIGEITVKCSGPQAMVNFSNLLFHFGEFSGVGIKTAMGMGNISVAEKMVGKESIHDR